MPNILLDSEPLNQAILFDIKETQAPLAISVVPQLTSLLLVRLIVNGYWIGASYKVLVTREKANISQKAIVSQKANIVSKFIFCDKKNRIKTSSNYLRKSPSE